MNRPQPQLGTQRDVVGRRIVAWLIDAVILAVVGGTVIGAAGALNGRLASVLGTFYGLLAFAYFIYMESAYGQTIGKRLVDIVVVKEDGGDLDVTASAVRNVLRVVDGFGLYLVGIVAILATGDRQRIGDIAADTVVVRTAEVRAPVDSPTTDNSTRPVR